MESANSGSTMNLTAQNQAPASRILVILVIVVGLVAVVAVIVAAVSLSRPSTPNITIGGSTINPGGTSGSGGVQYIPTSTGGSSSTGKKVWTIHVGHDYGAYTYFGTQGYLAGFEHDLIAAVCDAAGIDCRTVWDSWKNCWDSSIGQHSHGGQGLLDRWYDACTGWYTTVNRVQVFSFSQPFIKPTLSYLYKKKGSTFDFTDLSGKKVAFVDGWASDEKCLARWKDVKNNVLNSDDVIHVPTPEQLLNRINAGDIGFATATDMDSYKDQVERSPTSYSCMIAGNAMMTRKDSNFASYWNQGFQKLMSNGKFKKLCDDAVKAHGTKGAIDCVNS